MDNQHHQTHDHESSEPHDQGSCGCDHSGEQSWQNRSLALSGILVGAGFFIRWAGIGPPAFQTAIFAAAIAAGGWFLLPGAWRALRRLRPNIALLMVIAVIGAALIGEWAEAATVVFLFGIAEWLEGWADRRADRATRALLELAPDAARVRQDDGRFEERPVGEVEPGAIVSVQSGQRVPLDGVVTRGNSSVNQAPITGESVPVEKAPGATVFAGTINGQGSLEIEVTKAAGDTTLAKIIRLVEQAQAQTAPTQRFVDTFAQYYTPLVTVAALFIFLLPPLFFGGDWNVWLYRACVLLIIACPCALVISTPVSIVVGLTALARRGVLVKGGAHLETLAKLRALAVDKTGTITEGKPRVTGVTAFAPATADEVIRIAAAIDENSSHPLAQAIVAYAKEKKIDAPKAENYQSKLGRGAEATIDGHPYFVGNHRFTHELGVCTPEIESLLAEIEKQGQSVVVVGHIPHNGCAGGVLGVLAVGDTVRAKAKDAIAALHAVRISKIVMLSGDNQRTVDHIARQVGIDEARGDLLPDDKVAAITKLREQHRFVAMVGDGVNDAPAMATASLGIAMGAAGTDAAIETADVALMQDDLGQIAEAIWLGQRTLRTIHVNIAFSLGLKAIFLVLALAGHTSLWLAIVADTGATLLVVSNSLRLLRVTPQAN
jgi:Zn2+/Cd2+-exporting ATPase